MNPNQVLKTVFPNDECESERRYGTINSTLAASPIPGHNLPLDTFRKRESFKPSVLVRRLKDWVSDKLPLVVSVEELPESEAEVVTIDRYEDTFNDVDLTIY